ncbi:MAG TPA: VWA domain-containing protein [Candidatus Hydrogenedentes bacterium]|nr:VWA domain-containing protein [Candidatus Hydrogenedentota bacterium]
MNSGITFSFPFNSAFAGGSLLLLAALAVAWSWRTAERRRTARLLRFAMNPVVSTLYPAVTDRLRQPLGYFVLGGVIFGILALYQPRWGTGWQQTLRTSRDILIVLDVSESMNAASPPPSRLARARQKIELLMDRCPGDRFGLVVFSGEAALLAPLTLDRNYTRSVLRAVDTDTLNIEGTNFSAALKEVARVFEEDARKTGASERYARVAVFFSDGEQTSGNPEEDMKQVGEWASVFFVGIGSPDGSVVRYPQWMNRYTPLPEDRQTHVAGLDEGLMTRLAEAGGGVYVRMTPDDQDIRFITSELEQLRGRSHQEALRASRVNRYRWPLFIAFLCVLLEGFWLKSIPVITARLAGRSAG